MDKRTGHLVGNTWGSRRFAEWDLRGKQLKTWDNPNFVLDYQDCQYVPDSRMLCGGVTNLPQTPAAGGAAATYELGGVAMIDLRSHAGHPRGPVPEVVHRRARGHAQPVQDDGRRQPAHHVGRP